MAANRPRFICDAMLGGLARWLRAAGYSAHFDVHIKDGELVRRALEEGRCLLTSDSGVMERFAVATGLVKSVFIAPGRTVLEQLSRVMQDMKLPLVNSRCMKCDGELTEVSLAEVARHVPAKVGRLCSQFFQCRACGKVYWHGTHWTSMQERLRAAACGHEPG